MLMRVPGSRRVISCPLNRGWPRNIRRSYLVQTHALPPTLTCCFGAPGQLVIGVGLVLGVGVLVGRDTAEIAVGILVGVSGGRTVTSTIRVGTGVRDSSPDNDVLD